MKYRVIFNNLPRDEMMMLLEFAKKQNLESFNNAIIHTVTETPEETMEELKSI